MSRIGKHYIIEIEDEVSPGLYRIKNFRTLVFDEHGLNKLVPLNAKSIKYFAGFNKDLNDEAYQRGLNDAWDAANKIISFWQVCENQTLCDLLNVDVPWGHSILSDIFSSISAEQAIKKLDDYKNGKAEKGISIGDEVTNGDEMAIVTFIRGPFISGMKEDGDLISSTIEDWKKTGRHFDQISEILSAMKPTH